MAKTLAARENAILLVLDDLLAELYPGEVIDIALFVEYSNRISRAMVPHICTMVSKGMTVVLDFPGNTRRQRAWFTRLIELSGADHELHYIDVSDEVCKQQLAKRSQSLPEGSAWTTEAEFEAITAHFDPPADEEGFNVIHHRQGGLGLDVDSI